MNLSARPISRVIQPSVIEYAPISAPATTAVDDQAPVPTLVPALAFGNRFDGLNAGEQQVVPLKLWGAQVSEGLQSTIEKNGYILGIVLLAAAGLLLLIRTRK